MAYTVVMDVLVFSKEVFENVSSIPVFVSIYVLLFEGCRPDHVKLKIEADQK